MSIIPGKVKVGKGFQFPKSQPPGTGTGPLLKQLIGMASAPTTYAEANKIIDAVNALDLRIKALEAKD